MLAGVVIPRTELSRGPTTRRAVSTIS